MNVRSQAKRVADRFGGMSAMAASTGISMHSIRNWQRFGTIPEPHWLVILLAARRDGFPLEPYDFVAHVADALIERIAAERAQTSGAVPA